MRRGFLPACTPLAGLLAGLAVAVGTATPAAAEEVAERPADFAVIGWAAVERLIRRQPPRNQGVDARSAATDVDETGHTPGLQGLGD